MATKIHKFLLYFPGFKIFKPNLYFCKLIPLKNIFAFCYCAEEQKFFRFFGGEQFGFYREGAISNVIKDTTLNLTHLLSSQSHHHLQPCPASHLIPNMSDPAAPACAWLVPAPGLAPQGMAMATHWFSSCGEGLPA